MAGSITVSSITLDSDNNFSILSNTGATIFFANTSGVDIANSIGATAITNDKILSVANTKISGNIISSQIAPSVTLTTPLISGNLNFDANGTTGLRSPAANTLAFHTAGTEDMRIDSSGNVGIGKTPGTSILDIAGEGTSGSNNIYHTWSAASSGYAPAFNLRKSNGTKASPTAVSNEDELGVVVFAGYDGSNYVNSAYIQAKVDGTSGTNDMPGRIGFFTSADGSASPTERMRITSGGNLWMADRGSAGASGQMRVGMTSSGGINAYAEFIADANSAYPLGIKGLSTDQGMIGFFNTNNSVVGSITKSASATQYNTSSDYRLKENIAPMTGALGVISQLKPVTYTWKIDGSDGQGFIAHELQSVVPDCVYGEKDAVETYTDEDGNEQTRIKPQGVDTSFLVATLTAAIQELKALNDTQAATITALTARIVALES